MAQGLQKIGALVPSPDKLLSLPTNSPAEIAFATKAAAVLFGSYPAAKAHDPEIFTATVTKLFLRYSRQIVLEVVQELPLKREKGWDGIPSMARIHEALDACAERYEQKRLREERVERQMAERRAEDQMRHDALTKEDMAAKYPDIAHRLGWIKAEGEPEHVRATAQSLMSQYGLTQEQWDAIPELAVDEQRTER